MGIFGDIFGDIFGSIFGEGEPVVPPEPPAPPPVVVSYDAYGDLKLTWSLPRGDADITLVSSGWDLETEPGIETAVILSLFVDRRAESDDKPPSGDPGDRRGWWGDEFSERSGDMYGSRLWLLARAKRTTEAGLRAKEYVREALAWMIEDRVVSSIDVETEVTATALLIGVGINRPGGDRITYRFAHAWDHMQDSSE